MNGAEIRLNRSESGEGLLSESITGFDISAGSRFSVDVEPGRPLAVGTGLRMREGATLSVERGRLEVSRLILDEGHLLDIENGALDIGEISTVLSLEGESGWRMFGPPATGITYQELLGGVFTQGIPGASTPNGTPNVFVWNAEGGQYEVPADLGAPATQAVLIFMFEESQLPADLRNGTGLPFSRVQGDGIEAGGMLLSGASQRFHLLHNPFGTPVTLDEAATGVSRSNLYNTFYVWDAALDPGDGQAKGGWRFGNALLENVQPIINEFNIDENDQQRFPFESLETSVIAPFQGFLVEVETEAGPGGFTLTEQARRNEAAFIGNPAGQEAGARPGALADGREAAASQKTGQKQGTGTADFGQPGLLGLALEHVGNGAKTSALLVFSETGAYGFDGYDIRLRQSLTNNSVQLFSRSADAQRLRLNHLPQQAESPLELPLDYAAGAAFETHGSYRLSWPIIERIPSRWGLELVDTHSGETVDMRRTQEYQFDVQATAGAVPRRGQAQEQLEAFNAIMKEDTPDKQTADRFLIRILPPESGDEPVRLSRELSGPNEGWRMLSAPAHGITYAELLSGLWTQGFPGAAAGNGSSSVFVYEESSRSWQPPASLSNYFGTRSSESEAAENAGKAALVYVFGDDNYDGTPDGWPKHIGATAFPLSGTYEQAFSFTPEAQNGDEAQAGWHLTGNPFSFALNWSAVMEDADNRESGISDAVYVWDANLGRGGYRVFNSLLSLADMLAEDVLVSSDKNEAVIEPFQGFWLKTGRDEAVLRLRERHDHASVNKQPSEGAEPGLIALSLSGKQLHAGAGLSFTGHGQEGEDAGDAPQLASLSGSALYFYSTSAGGRALSINNLPVLSGGERIIPLYVESSESGTFELGLGRRSGLPAETELWLHDLATGQEWRLEDGFRQNVFIEADMEQASGEALSAGRWPVRLDQSRPAAAAPRFELHIIEGVPSSAEETPSLPEAITLKQNYPNPFNPATQIEYGLPEAGPVRLEVFNMLGQRVAVLVDTPRPAGYHRVRFDASALSSGVYVYRLSTESGARTARMTLLK